MVDKEADVKAFANYKEGEAPKAEVKETLKPVETAAPKKPAASAQSNFFPFFLQKDIIIFTISQY